MRMSICIIGLQIETANILVRRCPVVRGIDKRVSTRLTDPARHASNDPVYVAEESAMTQSIVRRGGRESEIGDFS